MTLWRKRRESRKALEKRAELLERIARMQLSFGIHGEAPWTNATAEALYLATNYGHEGHMVETVQIAANVWLRIEVKNS